MNYEEQDYDEIFKAVLDDSVEMGLISKADDFSSVIANRIFHYPWRPRPAKNEIPK